jgi:hypothetical protein
MIALTCNAPQIDGPWKHGRLMGWMRSQASALTLGELKTAVA